MYGELCTVYKDAENVNVCLLCTMYKDTENINVRCIMYGVQRYRKHEGTVCKDTENINVRCTKIQKTLLYGVLCTVC